MCVLFTHFELRKLYTSNFNISFMAPKRLLQCIALPMLLLLISFAASAQNKTITGKVTDSKDGSPIVGVTIQVKGSRSPLLFLLLQKS